MDAERHRSRARSVQRQVSVVARLNGPVAEPGWDVDDLGLEELVLAYLGRVDPMNEKVAS